MAEEGVASSSEENSFPFSPLVPAALSALKKLQPGEEKTTGRLACDSHTHVP